MIIRENSSTQTLNRAFAGRSGERGAALAAALLMLGLLSAVAMTVLAVVTTETRIAGSDLKRTQTFYCSAAGIEKMTSDYSALFQQSARPTETQISAIAVDYPQELYDEGFSFEQSIVKDVDTLTSMQNTQGISDPKLPIVTLPADSAFNGLIASVKPYVVKSKCTARNDGTSVSLTRTMNNYLIPLFQFGMFSDNDIEIHPGPDFTFNGRVHANGNIYVNGSVKFLDKVTTANEFIYDVLRNGSTRTGATVSMQVGAVNVAVTKGSMTNGPNITTATATPVGQRGYFPGSPNGTINTTWNTSVAPAASGTPNRFGGQLLTRTTGASPLKLPLQLDNNPTRELIKRRMPNDSPDPAFPTPLSDARYHSKAGIRILIDDEGVTNDAAGLYATQNGDGTNTHDGVNLSTFDPIPLPNSDALSGGGRALWRVPGAGTAYTETILNCPYQQNGALSTQALTVRGVKAALLTNVTPAGSTVAIPKIPAGAGLRGHILIQIEDANGVWRDVTREILSMGMTVGEPNAIIHLQRPLWTAFTQGSRASSGGTNQNLVDILNSTVRAVDGEIQTSPAPTVDSYGHLTSIADDLAALDLSVAHPIRAEVTPTVNTAEWGTTAWNTNKRWNSIVPINIYNAREGHLKTSVTQNAVYERGITSVIELNMRNLARWMDGVYDQNLLAGTNALSANINKPDGYVVYVSDRRGDKVKSMVDLSGATINSTNGMVDNLDIYGPNGTMDPGEDVRNTGLAAGSSLGSSTTAPFLKDTTELPDPVNLTGTSGGTDPDRIKRAISVSAWSNPNNYFRRSVRLFNGEDLQTTGAAGKLSTTLGITVATENMAYIWGNYNTTGINKKPGNGETSLNDPAADSNYTGNQVPASIVADAIFPLSKTWFDSSSALHPDDYTDRRADRSLPGVTSETSVRAAIIAGNNRSALDGTPDADNDNDSRLSGGMHNFPRFLEDWLSDDRRWNFVGSFVPLYHSTQALGPWWYVTNGVSIYGAPERNWAYDTTFLEMDRLPPGTPTFQHVEPTGFKQIL